MAGNNHPNRSKKPKWQPIEDVPEGRYLVWVADGGSDGKGAVAFGTVSLRSSGRSYRADGHSGEWEITHAMPIPGQPR